MDDANINSWTPIENAPPLAANGTVVSVEPGNPPGSATSNTTQQWQPVGTEPQGSANPNASSSWSSAPGLIPGATQSSGAPQSSTAPQFLEPGMADVGGIAALNGNAEVRHGGPFSQNAWKWSLGAVTAIIGIIVLIEVGLSKFIDRFDSGTTQRFTLICFSLFTNDVVMLGVLIVVAKRMGMTFRSFGVRRPADVKESVVLGFAAWLIFILLAGVWTMVSQSAAEREANNPFLRERAVNSRDSSATGSTNDSDVPTNAPTSADESTGTGNTGTSNTGNGSTGTSNTRHGSTGTSGPENGNSGTSSTGTSSTGTSSTGTSSTGTNGSENGNSSSGSTGNRSARSSDAGDQEPGISQESRISEDAGNGNTTNEDVADNRHALIKVLNDDPPKALLISILIAGCIGAPLLEELLVRGFLFGAFSQRFGKLAGAAISSLLFGFAHIMAYPLKMIPPLVLMGIALAWLAWQTGSIVPGIFIHAFVNSLGLGIAASLGGHVFTLMVGSWLIIALILVPWLRTKPRSLSTPS